MDDNAVTLDEDLKPGEQPYYRVRIRTKGRALPVQRQGEELRLQAGMTVSAEIRTGSNTVLRFLSKPLVKTLDNALGER